LVRGLPPVDEYRKRVSLACLKSENVSLIEDDRTSDSVDADPIRVGDLPDREEGAKGILI